MRDVKATSSLCSEPGRHLSCWCTFVLVSSRFSSITTHTSQGSRWMRRTAKQMLRSAQHDGWPFGYPGNPSGPWWLLSALEEDDGWVIEEVVPVGGVLAPLWREARRHPLDVAQSDRLQGFFVGDSAQVVVVKCERAAILENRIRNRCARPKRFAGALDESILFSGREPLR